MHRFACFSILLAATEMIAAAQTPAQRVSRYFTRVNQEVLDMARDFPAEKYDYKLTPETRSFGEVIVHVASGNIYGAKAGRGEKVNWDELDPKDYKGKDAIVALLVKSIEDAGAVMKASPEGPSKSLEPWLGVMEHSAEHYGLLVAYYRANGMVPPESRPKSK
jgi:hypothetical protein